MTGVFEIYLRTPEDDAGRYPPTDVPMKEERIKVVELPQEIGTALFDWWQKADCGDEFVIRCDLPV